MKLSNPIYCPSTDASVVCHAFAQLLHRNYTIQRCYHWCDPSIFNIVRRIENAMLPPTLNRSGRTEIHQQLFASVIFIIQSALQSTFDHNQSQSAVWIIHNNNQWLFLPMQLLVLDIVRSDKWSRTHTQSIPLRKQMLSIPAAFIPFNYSAAHIHFIIVWWLMSWFSVPPIMHSTYSCAWMHALRYAWTLEKSSWATAETCAYEWYWMALNYDEMHFVVCFLWSSSQHQFGRLLCAWNAAAAATAAAVVAVLQ